MHVVLVGMSHKTAPVGIRELLALNEAETIKALRELKNSTVIEEVIVLSTCNRTEFYVCTRCPVHAERTLGEFIKDHTRCGKDLTPFLYRLRDQAVCRHLFAVASSLDSQIVGESQILGQVKKALQLAEKQRAAREQLRFLFEKALLVAQTVRARSGIGQGSVSIGSVGVQLAKKVFGDLTNKTVLLLGAGEVGKLVVKYLNSEKVKKTWIVNRTFERAQMLQEQSLGEARPFEELKALIQETDVLIAAVDGKLKELSCRDLEEVALKRTDRSLVVIDLGVPRTFVEKKKSARLHVLTLDDLQAIADQNRHARVKAITLAKKLIDREVSVFYAQQAHAAGQTETELFDPAGFVGDLRQRPACAHRRNQGYGVVKGDRHGRKGITQKIS
jgi:glutamyl-tRNA reductase